MWCPEGYITLSEISNILAWETLLAIELTDSRIAELQRTIEKPQASDEDDRDELLGEVVEAEAFQAWLMTSFIERFSGQIRVTLPSGCLAKLDSIAFSKTTHHELGGSNYCFVFPSERVAQLKVRVWGFEFIEVRRMCVDVSAVDEEHWAQSLRPLHGLPLCIKETLVPRSAKDLIALICAKQLEASTDFSDDSEKECRLAYVFECYRTAFPDGKGEVIWSDVEAKTGYSRRQILRARSKFER